MGSGLDGAVTRHAIPVKVRNALLNEFDHRCAICSGERPHVHHIDEDASNNVIENLLPLCPNCHLRDQHSPTRRIEVQKLQLFRRHKDPAILLPQFHPLYVRQAFLTDIEPGDGDVTGLEAQATELIEFISDLEMGKCTAGASASSLGPCEDQWFSLLGPVHPQCPRSGAPRIGTTVKCCEPM